MEEIRLWDGKTYQYARIREHFPELAAYVEGSKELVEVISTPKKRTVSGLRARIVPLAVLFGLPLAACVAWIGTAGNGSSFLIWFAVAWLLTTVAGCLAYLTASVGTFRWSRTIRVENGLMTVVSRGSAERFALDECRWFHGFTYHDADTQAVPLSFGVRRCLIIHPRGWRRQYACGLSQEMLSIWSEFLTLAEIPPV